MPDRQCPPVRSPVVLTNDADPQGSGRRTPPVRIEPWSEDDLELLHAANAPRMMDHLGGPETDEKVLARHRRYLESAGTGAANMFRIVLLPEGAPVGVVGYWARSWQDETVYETGWSVLLPFQGRGIAPAAVSAVLTAARSVGRHRHVHAFPSVDNAPSNAVCRKAGFTLLGECDFEFPPGSIMRCNDWHVDLDGP